MSFAIFRNNKKTVRNTFTSYEKARQYVRKLIRSQNSKGGDLFWTTNPMIGDYGYSIRTV
jgi:hypothetical protein